MTTSVMAIAGGIFGADQGASSSAGSRADER
jgi:hypothetical protein